MVTRKPGYISIFFPFCMQMIMGEKARTLCLGHHKVSCYQKFEEEKTNQQTNRFAINIFIKTSRRHFKQIINELKKNTKHRASKKVVGNG